MVELSTLTVLKIALILSRLHTHRGQQITATFKQRAIRKYFKSDGISSKPVSLLFVESSRS